MKIYHPSNRKFKIVKVKYFGEHNYTKNDMKASLIPRSFWYRKCEIPELRFKNCKYTYVTKIPKCHLYNLKIDAENYIKKYKSIDEMLFQIKKKWKGVLYNVEYDMIALFYDTKPIKIIEN
jgi:hypothetical protein